jgi:predicted SprT family Zn-dependent metalloprotease
MGKFVISESERREILALHESYKKSLLQEQESDIPTSLPQNDIELTKFAEPIKEQLLKDVQSDAAKKKIMGYEVAEYPRKVTPENDINLYNKFLNEIFIPKLKTVKFLYSDSLAPTTSGEWSIKDFSISINRKSIIKSALKQNITPESELTRVITHELRHFLYDTLSEVYYIPTDYTNFMWDMNKPKPTVVSNNKYSGFTQYTDPYTYDTSEILARMAEFRKILGIKSDETYTPEQMKGIMMNKFKNIYSKYPQLTPEEFNKIKNLPKTKRQNPISKTSKEFAIEDERGVNIGFWYKGDFKQFLEDFKVYANDVTWMMNLITTLKLEGYFYVDYSIASHVQDYFVSVEKGDNKNIG